MIQDTLLTKSDASFMMNFNSDPYRNNNIESLKAYNLSYQWKTMNLN